MHLCITVSNENREIIEELKKRGLDVSSSDRGVVINLPDVLFAFNRSDLTPEAQATVREIADVIKGSSNRHISIEGHTDAIGSIEYNRRLSESRARAVYSEIEANNVPARRLSTRGFGESKPIASNQTDQGRRRNRRVEVIIENNR